MPIQLPWTLTGGTPCCCPGDCCLYPVAAPDELPGEIIYHAVQGDITMTKVGDHRYEGVDPVFGITYYIKDNLAGLWAVGQVIDGFDDAPFEYNNCLITIWPGVPDSADDTVSDEFEDSYNVFADPDNVTVNRISICEWTGIYHADIGDVTWRLFYDDGDPPTAFSYKWRLDLGSVTATKEDPQSSPVGDYKILGVTIATVS